ncbi:hypothetical protein [Corynebacterium renale]|uniref:hypothetical protein n=2 Tax=Corynebacterium renale TaxID=1724 RepID=UPI000E03C7BA|nr:hypothetical protein [Corynebacterium renale]STC97631.1 Uncharacterised protein [Corynebacterium renale]
MVDEFDLRDAITALKEDFFRLEELKWERPKTAETARKMEPVFGSSTPTPDGDWSLNLEDCLLQERRDEAIPGGLLKMAYDALSYTISDGASITPHTGAMVCAHLWRNAAEIADKFPAAQELLELIREQHRFLQREFVKREGNEPPRKEARQTATIICALLSQRGINITPAQLRKWAQRGKITTTKIGGHNGYLLSEVIAHLTSTATPQHEGTP